MLFISDSVLVVVAIGYQASHAIKQAMLSKRIRFVEIIKTINMI